MNSWKPIKVARKPMDLTLTAMIDIMFVLLLFFMTATTFGKKGITLTSPSSSQAQTLNQSSLNLYLTEDGTVYNDHQEALSLKELKAWLSPQLSSGSSAITVHADKNSKTQMLLSIIDICKEGGASQVNLVAKAAIR